MNFLGLEKEFTDEKKSKIIILPVPFEKTTSYMKGTKYSPEAIIKASEQVELYDEEFDNEAYTEGLYTDPYFYREVNLDKLSIDNGLEKIKERVDYHLKNNKMVISIGGEHSITALIFKSYWEKYNNDIGIIQFDAHGDLRESYHGEKFSHASIMKRVFDYVDSKDKVLQIGIRAISKEESIFIKERNLNLVKAHELYNDKNVYKKFLGNLPKQVYITIDLDFFDSSELNHLGTPEPGGFSYREYISILKDIKKTKTIVGFDVNELASNKESKVSDFYSARLMYKTINCIFS